MADPFLSEIRIMSFDYAPEGWALCDGQLLPIAQNPPLFSLLGTTFGGDGQVNFALPDLRGRTPIHIGGGHMLGERGGEREHALSIAELPPHTHVLNASGVAATKGDPTNNLLAQSPTTNPVYGSPTSLVTMAPQSVTNTGGSQAHLNMQPFLTITFCIALVGIFPSVD